MIWNDLTITVAAIAACLIVHAICETIIDYFKIKNKNK